MGTNVKMNEARAAMGLALIPYIDEIITKRKQRFNLYIEYLKNIPGIKLLSIPDDVEYNYAYFSILIQQDFPLTRDELFNKFQENNIDTQKYIYPLNPNFFTLLKL